MASLFRSAAGEPRPG